MRGGSERGFPQDPPSLGGAVGGAAPEPPRYLGNPPLFLVPQASSSSLIPSSCPTGATVPAALAGSPSPASERRHRQWLGEAARAAQGSLEHGVLPGPLVPGPAGRGTTLPTTPARAARRCPDASWDMESAPRPLFEPCGQGRLHYPQTRETHPDSPDASWDIELPFLSPVGRRRRTILPTIHRRALSYPRAPWDLYFLLALPPRNRMGWSTTLPTGLCAS